MVIDIIKFELEFFLQAYDNVLNELSKLERQDRDRRQKEIQNLPVRNNGIENEKRKDDEELIQKSIFIPPWRREEEREEKQRQMETAFEQVYQENHRKGFFSLVHIDPHFQQTI